MRGITANFGSSSRFFLSRRDVPRRCPVFTSLYFRVDRSLVVILGTRGRDLHGKREIYIGSLWFEYTRGYICTLCKKKKEKRDIRELPVRVARNLARTRVYMMTGGRETDEIVVRVWNWFERRMIKGAIRVAQLKIFGISGLWISRFRIGRNEDDNYICEAVICVAIKKREEEKRGERGEREFVFELNEAN